MNILLGLLSILLGLVLWGIAGILPVLRLYRTAEGADHAVSVTLAVTWMGAFTLWQRTIPNVQGARLIRDPAAPKQVRVELKTPEGDQALTTRYAQREEPRAHLVQLIEGYVKNQRRQPVDLPLRKRMSLMIGFGVFFPLGTISLFTGVLLVINAMH